jgi:hypothetical protein
MGLLISVRSMSVLLLGNATIDGYVPKLLNELEFQVDQSQGLPPGHTHQARNTPLKESLGNL